MKPAVRRELFTTTSTYSLQAVAKAAHDSAPMSRHPESTNKLSKATQETVSTSRVTNGHEGEQTAFLFVLPWSLINLGGGVNQVVVNLAWQMKRTGSFAPIVLIADWDAIHPVWEEIHGVRTVRWRIRTFHPTMGLKERISYWLWERRFKLEFEKFCTQHRVQVLNIHYVGPVAFTFDRIRKSFSRVIPLLLSFHGTDLTDLRALSKSEISYWQEFFPRVTAVIVCSRNLGQRFTELFGKAVAPCVIHNGLDVNSFIATSGTPPRPAGERYILTVGRFDRQKGQDVLIEAFAEIAEEYPSVNLVLVGTMGNALTGLQELCHLRGIQERIHFYPDRPHREVAEFLRQAEIFVLPSRLEAFPIVLLEAGALSLPVVATNVGGIPELLTDGITGRLVSPDSPSELAQCMRILLNDPAASRQMGWRLFEHVSANFTWEIAHNRYLGLT